MSAQLSPLFRGRMSSGGGEGRHFGTRVIDFVLGRRGHGGHAAKSLLETRTPNNPITRVCSVTIRERVSWDGVRIPAS